MIDAAILSPPQVWQASGHLANFSDPLVDCTNCKNRFRLDKLDDPDTCPNCGEKNSFTEAREFNLMFKTQAGPVEGTGADAYLRPETAQGMFTNFAQVLQTSRKKPPFGIAQVGKSFRNEITPQNWIFRTREFEQMEMEFFVPPDESEQWYEYWCNERLNWYKELGIPEDMLLLRPHDDDELSHYSTGTSDVEFKFPWGFDELEGIAQRTDFDLKAHCGGVGGAARLLRSADQRALRAVRDRARRRRHPDDGGVPAGGLRRRRGERREPDRAAAASASRAVQDRRAAVEQEGHAHAARPRGPQAARRALHGRLRRDPEHRQALPPPGRDRHAARR